MVRKQKGEVGIVKCKKALVLSVLVKSSDLERS